MKKLFAIIAVIIPVAISVFSYPNGAISVLICIPFVLLVASRLRKMQSDQDFLIMVFVAAFFLRILVAVFIYEYKLEIFFGGDAIAHEFHGYSLYEVWNGTGETASFLNDWNKPWGLHLLIATVYSFIGRNPLAIQFISSFCGAMTAVLIYLCTFKIFKNRKASKVASILTAFSPAMIIWSSQILKDGIVVFLVVAAVYFLLRLQEEFSWIDTLLLLASLAGTLSVRFYIFYFASFACVGSFMFGSEKLVASNIRWLVILTALLVVFSYAGVLTVGTEQLERISNIERIQYSREVLAREAGSGFAENSDITTPTGALAALPVGFAYLMLAPFPWEFGSFRSLLPLPEMIVWWALIPLLISGFAFTVRKRFRQSVPILLFAIALTIAYSLFQTNVGTAYRQRTQIQVFLFMFIAVGWTLREEKKENLRLVKEVRHRMTVPDDLDEVLQSSVAVRERERF